MKLSAQRKKDCINRVLFSALKQEKSLPCSVNGARRFWWSEAIYNFVGLSRPVRTRLIKMFPGDKIDPVELGKELIAENASNLMSRLFMRRVQHAVRCSICSWAWTYGSAWTRRTEFCMSGPATHLAVWNSSNPSLRIYFGPSKVTNVDQVWELSTTSYGLIQLLSDRSLEWSLEQVISCRYSLIKTEGQNY